MSGEERNQKMLEEDSSQKEGSCEDSSQPWGTATNSEDAFSDIDVKEKTKKEDFTSNARESSDSEHIKERSEQMEAVSSNKDFIPDLGKSANPRQDQSILCKEPFVNEDDKTVLMICPHDYYHHLPCFIEHVYVHRTCPICGKRTLTSQTTSLIRSDNKDPVPKEEASRDGEKSESEGDRESSEKVEATSSNKDSIQEAGKSDDPIQDQCSICEQPFLDEDDRIIPTICPHDDHYYHVRCIVMHLFMNQTCPICGKETLTSWTSSLINFEKKQPSSKDLCIICQKPFLDENLKAESLICPHDNRYHCSCIIGYITTHSCCPVCGKKS